MSPQVSPPNFRAPPCSTSGLRRRRIAGAFVAALLAAGLASAAPLPALTVATAISLAPAMRELAAAFEAHAPGLRVAVTSAASGSLLQQLAAGAPIDLFVAADMATMQRAQTQGLLRAGSIRVLASNTLVLVQPVGQRAAGVPRLAGLVDLASAPVQRVALGAPASVPAGAYARSALEAAGLWPALAPRAVYGQNVRQVLDFVVRGEVDAGFVYATDAAQAGAAVQVVAAVPTPRPIHYPVAIAAASGQAALAVRFIAFLFEPGARALLDQRGFGRP